MPGTAIVIPPQVLQRSFPAPWGANVGEEHWLILAISVANLRFVDKTGGRGSCRAATGYYTLHDPRTVRREPHSQEAFSHSFGAETENAKSSGCCILQQKIACPRDCLGRSDNEFLFLEPETSNVQALRSQLFVAGASVESSDTVTVDRQNAREYTLRLIARPDNECCGLHGLVSECPWLRYQCLESKPRRFED